MRKRIVVIAGSFIEYCFWLQMNGQSPNVVAYVDSLKDLDGPTIGVVIRTGNYYLNPMSNHPDLLAIEEGLKTQWRSE